MKLWIDPLQYSYKKSLNDIKRCVNLIFATKFSNIFLLHGKYSFGKVINEV